MLTCPACGFDNHSTALFCESCGARFESEAAPAKPPAEELALVLVSSVDGRQFTVEPERRTALIGRKDRTLRTLVDIDPTGEHGQEYGLSRRHARVHSLNGRFMLEDLESLNGTYLNERKLRPYLPEVLHDGDMIRLGDLTLRVSLKAIPSLSSSAS